MSTALNTIITTKGSLPIARTITSCVRGYAGYTKGARGVGQGREFEPFEYDLRACDGSIISEVDDTPDYRRA